MTPWGLRSRVKGLVQGALGRPGTARGTDADQIRVRLVLPDGAQHEVTCEPRYTLVMASQTLDTPIATGCPDGQCGGCNVDVLEGADALLPPSAAEQKLLTEKHAARANVRLACHAKVVGNGATVKVHNVWRMESTRGER
jgi:ferredoxin